MVQKLKELPIIDLVPDKTIIENFKTDYNKQHVSLLYPPNSSPRKKKRSKTTKKGVENGHGNFIDSNHDTEMSTPKT